MIDFDTFKINCSQIGSLLGTAMWSKRPTEREVKKLFNTLGRDYGELSEAMKFNAREIIFKQINYDPGIPSESFSLELVLTYAYQMYGKGKVSQGNDSPHAAEKGSMAEPEAIKFLSKMDGIEYSKNEELFENNWFKGIPDIIIRSGSGKVQKIIEVKTSYDLPSFIMSMRKSEKTANVYETMGYMDILKCKNAEIVHCLVDMPGKIAEFEEKRLRDRYQWLQLSAEDASERIKNTLNNMEYSGIPDEFKIFRRPISLNGLTMKMVKQRATRARGWLRDIHDLFTKNRVSLPQVESDNQEDNV